MPKINLLAYCENTQIYDIKEKGEIVHIKCSFKKILEEHSDIASNEAYLKPLPKVTPSKTISNPQKEEENVIYENKESVLAKISEFKGLSISRIISMMPYKDLIRDFRITEDEIKEALNVSTKG